MEGEGFVVHHVLFGGGECYVGMGGVGESGGVHLAEVGVGVVGGWVEEYWGGGVVC